MTKLLSTLRPSFGRTRPVTARLGLAAVVLAMVGAAAAVTPGAAQAATSEGLLCDQNTHNSFVLTADDGYISTPDGNSIYTWSYADETQRAFQFPGPVLCVTTGATVSVTLHNHLPEATSIVFPGQKDVKADNQPVEPQLTTSGAMTSMVQSAEAGNGTTVGAVTYTFTAGSPGTYLYQSGTDADKQQQMGLYGALVVRPPPGPDTSTPVRTPPTARITSTSSCSRRSTPTCTWPWSVTRPSTGPATGPATT